MSQENLDWRTSGLPKNCLIVKPNGEANFSQFINESEYNVSAISFNQTEDLSRSTKRNLRSEQRRRISSIKFGTSTIDNTISPVVEFSESRTFLKQASTSYDKKLCSPLCQPIVKVARMSEAKIRRMTQSPHPAISPKNEDDLNNSMLNDTVPKINFCVQTSYEDKNGGSPHNNSKTFHNERVESPLPNTPKLVLFNKKSSQTCKNELTSKLDSQKDNQTNKENHSFKREETNVDIANDSTSHEDTCPSRLKDLTERDFSSIDGTPSNFSIGEKSGTSDKPTKKEAVTCRRCKKIILSKKVEKIQTEKKSAASVKKKPSHTNLEEDGSQESTIDMQTDNLFSEKQPVRKLQLVNEDDSVIPETRSKKRVSSEKKIKRVYRKKKRSGSKSSNADLTLEINSILEESLIVPRNHSLMSNFHDEDIHPTAKDVDSGDKRVARENQDEQINDGPSLNKEPFDDETKYKTEKTSRRIREKTINDELDVHSEKASKKERLLNEKTAGNRKESKGEEELINREACSNDWADERHSPENEEVPANNDEETSVVGDRESLLNEVENSKLINTSVGSSEKLKNDTEDNGSVNKEEEEVIANEEVEVSANEEKGEKSITEDEERSEVKEDNMAEVEENSTFVDNSKLRNEAHSGKEFESRENTIFKETDADGEVLKNQEHELLETISDTQNSNESLKLSKTPEKDECLDNSSNLTMVITRRQRHMQNESKEKLHEIPSSTGKKNKKGKKSKTISQGASVSKPKKAVRIPEQIEEENDDNKSVDYENSQVTKSTPARSIQNLKKFKPTEGKVDIIEAKQSSLIGGDSELDNNSNNEAVPEADMTLTEENTITDNNVTSRQSESVHPILDIRKSLRSSSKKNSFAVPEQPPIRSVRKSKRTNSHANDEQTMTSITSSSKLSDLSKMSTKPAKKAKSKSTQKKINSLSKKSKGNYRSKLSSISNFDDSDELSSTKRSCSRRISKNVSTLLVDSPDRRDDTFTRISRSTRFSHLSSVNSTRKSFSTMLDDDTIKNRESSQFSTKWRVSKVDAIRQSIPDEGKKNSTLNSTQKSSKLIVIEPTPDNTKESISSTDIDNTTNPRISFSTQSLYNIREEESNNEVTSSSTVLEAETIIQPNTANRTNVSFTPVNFLSSTPMVNENEIPLETPPSRKKPEEKTNSADLTNYKFQKKKRRETIFVPKITDSSKGLRRSKRKRVRPLLHECGERIKYTYNPTAGSYEIDQVIKPNKDKKKGLRNSMASNKRRIVALEKLEKKRDVENTKIRFANKTLPAQLVTRDSLPGNNSFEVSIRGERKVKHLIERFNRHVDFDDGPMIVKPTKSSAINYIHIRGGATHLLPASKTETTLILLYGKIQFFLEDNEGYLDAGDSLEIPYDVNVTIENLRRDPATFLIHEI
ncbi:DgyrCDS1263 [Dimorphilus gyrociliatus]|uniref:DgyrCDS1263 n=1 Tax=Dimorphilus gyrociliatus TaxID=2664684 RepID=A0A7I8VBU6_9ANNE|nr:DgyrCDS1263 [Dimorphilus gyrociliatus]